MKINGAESSPILPADPRSPASAPADAEGKQTPTAAGRLDRVEISTAGRAKAETLTPVTAAAPDRLDEVRRRLLTAAYDTNEVVGEVAQRILDRGDV